LSPRTTVLAIRVSVADLEQIDTRAAALGVSRSVYVRECCGLPSEKATYREATPADLAAHVAALPREKQVAALAAMLRACPDAAVDAKHLELELPEVPLGR
jgi:hypothetical protein